MKKIMNLFLVLCIMCSFIFLFGLKNINAYDTTTGNDEQAQKILNTFYHEGVYKKETSINLADASKAEVVKMFHASCNHLERITYYNNEEIWMTNEAGTINSGYETVDGDMKHFKKVDGVNVYDYTVENTITTEFYQTLKNLRNTSGWQLKNGAYVNDHEAVIDQFRQFVAPLWLATDDAKNYIILTEVKMYEVGEQLFIDLYTSSTDGGKLTNNDGLFARAIVSIERNEEKLEIISVGAHGNMFTHIGTCILIPKDSNVEISLIDINGQEHKGVLNTYIDYNSIYRFDTYNKIESTEWTIYVTYYAEKVIYRGSAHVKQNLIITLDGYKAEKTAVAENMPESLELTPNLYDELGWAQIQLYVTNAKSIINACESISEIDEVLIQLEKDLRSVEFKKFDLSELIDIYQDKIDKELAKVSSSDYSVENFELITSAAALAKVDIEGETTEKAMQTLVDNFIEYVASIEKLAIQLSTEGATWDPHGQIYIIVGWSAPQLTLPTENYLNSADVRGSVIATLTTTEGEVYNAVFDCQVGYAAVKIYFPGYNQDGKDIAKGGYTLKLSFVYNGNKYELTKNV